MTRPFAFSFCLFSGILMTALFPARGTGQAPPLRVLFLGNSYTYSNDMPAILLSLAASGGDRLDYEMEVPDGASLEEHYQRGSVAMAIKEGTWDYVVLQEQSLRPAMPVRQVEREFFKYGELLDRQIKTLHPGAKTVLYITWGRWRHTGSDWGSTPATASNTATAPSSTRRERSTSTVKSTWPGVSMMLIVWPSHWAVVAADVIVMPRSCSSFR